MWAQRNAFICRIISKIICLTICRFNTKIRIIICIQKLRTSLNTMLINRISVIILWFSRTNTNTKSSSIIRILSWSTLKNANSWRNISIITICYITNSNTCSCHWISIITWLTLCNTCSITVIDILSKKIRNHWTYINAFICWRISILRSSLGASLNTFSCTLICKISIWALTNASVIFFKSIIFRWWWTILCASLFTWICKISFRAVLYTWWVNIIIIKNSGISLTGRNANIIRFLAIKIIRTNSHTLLSYWISISIIRSSWSLRTICNTSVSFIISIKNWNIRASCNTLSILWIFPTYICSRIPWTFRNTCFCCFITP